MSYDFNTRPTPCDHYQRTERYVVDPSDLVTLLLQANQTQRMRAPINGQSSVKLYIGGALVTPDHAKYGYQILRDELTLPVEDPRSKIVFNQPVRTIQMIEVSYITQKTFCLRCSGLGQVTDVQKSNLGSFIHIIGQDKLVQRCLKFMLTSKCPFYPQFTSQIKAYIGRKFGISITQEDISYQTVNALQNLKNIQGQQRTVQYLQPSEILKDIVSVTAAVDQSNPTLVRVKAQVSSYAADQVGVGSIQFSIRTNQ